VPIRFFQTLRAGGLKPSVTEYLHLCEALSASVIAPNLDEFHLLARATLIKDEAQFDRFDQIFGAFFEASELALADLSALPVDWLQSELKRLFTDEEKAALAGMGSFEALMQTLRERLAEQTGKHQGGNRWIGTGGTSPFGNGGFNPEGVRIGGEPQHGRAVKVWQQRQFKDFDSDRPLDTRQMKLALRKLRQFARTGQENELDIDATIDSTAKNAGYLDLKMRPERHNAVKVLLLLDVGGSMDSHVLQVEQLFYSLKSEFKHLESYYFHNFIYEKLWRDNARRSDSSIDLQTLLNRFDRSYKLIFVGDASMSPYEILSHGGSIEHWNEQPGIYHLGQLLSHFHSSAWLNPIDADYWHMTASIQLVKTALTERMFALSLNGIDAAIACLRHRAS